MAKLTHKLQGNQESVLAKESAEDARGLKKGSPKGFASPKSRRDKVAKELVANAGKSSTLSTPLAMADLTVNKGEQLNAKGPGAVLARLEQKRGLGPPPPKRGAVTKAIVVDVKEGVKAGVKKLTDTGRAFCCAPETFDVDAFVGDLPFPTRSEATATLWAKVEV